MRLQFIFDGKPEAEVRDILKQFIVLVGNLQMHGNGELVEILQGIPDEIYLSNKLTRCWFKENCNPSCRILQLQICTSANSTMTDSAVGNDI